MNAKSAPFTTELKRLSEDLAASFADVDRLLEIAGRLAQLGAKITAACEREYVRMMELPAA